MTSTRQAEYARIHQNDFDDTPTLNGDSSSDAGESLIGHQRASGRRGKEWNEDDDQLGLDNRQGKRRWCSSAWVQCVLNVLLLIVVLGLLFERQAPSTTSTTTAATAATAATTMTTTTERIFEGNGDVTGFIPPVGQQIKTFVPNMSFVPENGTEFFSHEVQKMWLSIVPTGLGYVAIDEPEDYSDLPHPLKGYKDTVFTTSVTHQLHCLYSIVRVYNSLTSGVHIPKEMQGHLPHCFEYLRQSIMCCGDTALEGQHTTFPDGIIGSDGWDAKHVCKDYDSIYWYLQGHRADNKNWI